jgi:hypothetical protein
MVVVMLTVHRLLLHVLRVGGRTATKHLPGILDPPSSVLAVYKKGKIPLMTGFSEHPTTDEIEYVGPPGEPSHVHIPRPSRRTGGLITDDGSLAQLELVSLCTCADD